jgi:hypothetical protein
MPLSSNIDPEASEVPVNGAELRAYEKEERALAREIADQTGQLQARSSNEAEPARNPLGRWGRRHKVLKPRRPAPLAVECRNNERHRCALQHSA